MNQFLQNISSTLICASCSHSRPTSLPQYVKHEPLSLPTNNMSPALTPHVASGPHHVASGSAACGLHCEGCREARLDTLAQLERWGLFTPLSET